MNERINANHAKEPNEDAHGLTKERRDILLFIISRWIHSEGSSKHEQVLAPGHVW